MFGLMLVAAIVGGYAAHLVHVPRVVGYLLGGVALRAVLAVAVGGDGGTSGGDTLEAAARPLRAVKDLALGLILFNIGGVFERSKLRAVFRRVIRISALEIGAVLTLVFAVCALITLAWHPGDGAGEKLVLALLLAIAGVATAPAATLFVLQEYEAKGPVTETIVGLTAVNNIVCIVLFQLTFLTLASFDIIHTGGFVAQHLGLALLSSTVGSVVLGVVAGVTISVLHARLPVSQTLIFFFAIFLLLGEGEPWLWQQYGVSYNFLLTSLVVGATCANIAIDSAKLESTLRSVALPIFAGFFVMAGFDLHLGDLAHMGWLGGGYVLARLAGKWFGCKLGVRWAGAPDRADGRIGPALLCQAAVVIGLASFVERSWDSPLASQFATVILGSVVVFELIGPLLVKRCTVQAGEVKAVTLLRRSGEGDDVSIVRVTLRALARFVGWGADPETSEPGKLLVHHIMRTNVELIPESATFDEVLHEIERSTHAHFPVVHEDGSFAGVIHFSDVRDVIYDPTLSQLVTAADLADADSPTVPSDMPLRELLDLFTSHNVAVLPVVERPDSKRVVGLVEQRDLLKALHLSRNAG